MALQNVVVVKEKSCFFCVFLRFDTVTSASYSIKPPRKFKKIPGAQLGRYIFLRDLPGKQKLNAEGLGFVQGFTA